MCGRGGGCGWKLAETRKRDEESEEEDAEK